MCVGSPTTADVLVLVLNGTIRRFDKMGVWQGPYWKWNFAVVKDYNVFINLFVCFRETLKNQLAFSTKAQLDSCFSCLSLQSIRAKSPPEHCYYCIMIGSQRFFCYLNRKILRIFHFYYINNNPNFNAARKTSSPSDAKGF